MYRGNTYAVENLIEFCLWSRSPSLLQIDTGVCVCLFFLVGEGNRHDSEFSTLGAIL